MPRQDSRAPRLFVDADLAAGIAVPLARDQSHYLGNVLRLGASDAVLAFNGRDGEWRSEIVGGKRPDVLNPIAQTRAQQSLPDLHYVFAPLKNARLDYMVQKAVEMGAAALQPVTTRFTQAHRLNLERMRANVVEAAEQCGLLALANVAQPSPLPRWLEARDAGRLLIFCDEAADVADPVSALATIIPDGTARPGLDVLIGSEGGFSDEERALVLRQRRTLRLALGPRILRADTAAVAALALVQAVLGDWTDARSR